VEAVVEAASATAPVRALVVDASSITNIDVSAVKMLKRLSAALAKSKTELFFGCWRNPQPGLLQVGVCRAVGLVFVLVWGGGGVGGLGAGSCEGTDEWVVARQGNGLAAAPAGVQIETLHSVQAESASRKCTD
jgi:hypothetical protein